MPLRRNRSSSETVQARRHRSAQSRRWSRDMCLCSPFSGQCRVGPQWASLRPNGRTPIGGSPCGHPAERQAFARRPVAGAGWVGRVLRGPAGFLCGSRPSDRLRGAGGQADTRSPGDHPARIKCASARRSARQPGSRRDHHARRTPRHSWLNTTPPRTRFALNARG